MPQKRKKMTENNRISTQSYLLDGMHHAFVGCACRIGLDIPVAVYDYDKISKILVSGGINADDVDEYIEFNILGAWVGDGTPIILRKMSISEFGDMCADG